MPYVSDKQEAYLEINKPDVAAKFRAHGGKKKKKKRKRMKSQADLEKHLSSLM